MPASAPRPARKHRSLPADLPLTPTMPCDVAFRIVARRHLRKLSDHHTATCAGDQEALHQMRIALTHLRSSIQFFSPMVKDQDCAGIKEELKWLNKHLGVVRDLDVALGRIVASRQAKDVRRLAAWKEKRAASHDALARTLMSARYLRLIDTASTWIEGGPWCSRVDEDGEQRRRAPVLAYALHKLSRWEKRLLKKSRKLTKLDVEKRHRLRLLNKKLNYAIDSCQDLFADERFSKQETALKYLRKAQRHLGQLNDDAREHALARQLRPDGAKTSVRSSGLERESRLLQKAATAYAKLARLETFRS